MACCYLPQPGFQSGGLCWLGKDPLWSSIILLRAVSICDGASLIPGTIKAVNVRKLLSLHNNI